MKPDTLLKSFQIHIKSILINYEYKFYILINFVFNKVWSLRSWEA